MIEILRLGALGLAPYQPGEGKLVSSTDPTKLKEYCACALPVITTAMPETAQSLAAAGAGIIIDYSTAALSDAVMKLLSNEQLWLSMQKNALEWSKNFHWPLIYTPAWEKIEKNLASDVL